MTAYASHRCFAIGGSDRRPRARVRVIARAKRACNRRGSEKAALAVVGSVSRALSTAQRAAGIAMRRPGAFVVEPETRERMWNRYVINRLTTRQLLVKRIGSQPSLGYVALSTMIGFLLELPLPTEAGRFL